MLQKTCVWLIAALILAARGEAADYYVNLAGSDLHQGASPAAPWQTLARVNQQALRAGDRVYLAGNQIFSGTLAFDSADLGSAGSPIVVSSYGTGRATVAAGPSSGVWVYNTAGITISNLNVVGAGRTSNSGAGVEFYADLPGNVKLASLRIDRVDVSGFGREGIVIGSWNGATGFRDVIVRDVVAHDNAHGGIATYAAEPNAHQNVYVGYSTAFGNPGVAGLSNNSGNGIVLGNVNGGTIERSLEISWGCQCLRETAPTWAQVKDWGLCRRARPRACASFASQTECRKVELLPQPSSRNRREKRCGESV